MNTHLILLCVIMGGALSAEAATRSKASPEKPSEIRLVSGKWSEETLVNMGGALDEGFELRENSWHWSETRGGKYSEYFKHYHTNSSTTRIETTKGHIEPDRTIPLEHVDVSGVNTAATNYNVTNVTLATGTYELGWLREKPQEQGALKSPIRHYGNWEKRSSKVNVVLRTGGRGGVKAENVFAITGEATERVVRPNPTVGGDAIIVDATNNVPFAEIRVPGLKKNLGLDGKAWASLPDNSEVKMTLEAGRPLYHFEVSREKFVFGRQTEHMALTDTNRLRTKLGVGEEVYLGFCADPAAQTNVNWTVSAGGLSASTWTNWATNLSYVGMKFTAPSNEVKKVKLTATVADAKPLEVKFKVVEPDRYDHADVTNLVSFTTNTAGAGIRFIVYMHPTDVSFYRIMMEEVGEDATNVQGYFTNNPPFDPSVNLSHKGSTAPLFPDGKHHGKGDDPFKLNWDNSWDHGWDNAYSFRDNVTQDGLSLSNWPGIPWSSGQWTWNIPGKWWVEGSSTTNNIPNGWQQIFTIDASGTMTVSKFGRTVTRTINQTTGTAN